VSTALGAVLAEQRKTVELTQAEAAERAYVSCTECLHSHQMMLQSASSDEIRRHEECRVQESLSGNVGLSAEFCR
jgi:hypothetical protein